MRRRRFIAAGAALIASNCASRAQPLARQYRLTIAHPDLATRTMTKEGNSRFKIFFEELEKAGFAEGVNLTVARFSGEGLAQSYPQIARDAVDSRPDVMLTISDRMTKLVKDIDGRVPIVAMTSDPIAYGLARSLAHPGENITGVMVNSSPGIFKKRIEYLKDIVPDVRGIFQLTSRTLWESPLGASVSAAVELSGLRLIGPPVESPHREPQYRAAFTEAAKQTNVVLVTTAVENYTNRKLVIDLIDEFRMIAFYPLRDYVDMGGLIGHDINMPDLYARMGKQVVSVLKGETVGDIPFYQPLQLKLIINARAASASGLTLPASLIARADELIE